MHLDLSHWSDRWTFFLGRWYDLETQLLMIDVINVGDTVVDVGANYGSFALLASRLVGREGKVVCFEPNPSASKKLDLEISSNRIENIQVHGFGLGAQDSELTLSVPFVNSGEATFGASAYSADANYQVRARITTGDFVLALDHPAFIKIDVEGFECDVIAGLEETIRRHHPMILTEVAPAHLERCGASAAKLRALMENFGYRGFRMGLNKEHDRYTWNLRPLEANGEACDALWLPRDSILIERFARRVTS